MDFRVVFVGVCLQYNRSSIHLNLFAVAHSSAQWNEYQPYIRKTIGNCMENNFFERVQERYSLQSKKRR